MAKTITVALPPDVKRSLDELSKKEGLSPEEVVGRAVKQHLFLRQFRTLRARMAAKAKNQGIETDQDVFDRVS